MAVQFALLIVPMSVMVFGAIDVSRASGEKMRLQDALDSATLAEPEDGPSTQWLREQAQQLGAVISGSLIIQAADGSHRNRLLWARLDGEVLHYDKRHLFALATEDEHYTAGDTRMIAQVNGWRINLMICYDLRFPVWARNVGDELLRELAAKGGVLQINALAVSLRDAPGNRRTAAIAEVLMKYRDRVISPETLAEEDRDYDVVCAAHPNPPAGFDDVIRHIDYAVDVMGIDHVGIGSDFDGIGDTPTGLEGVDKFPDLLAELDLARSHARQALQGAGLLVGHWKKYSRLGHTTGLSDWSTTYSKARSPE